MRENGIIMFMIIVIVISTGIVFADVLGSTQNKIHVQTKPLTNIIEEKIDTALYSRQLLVFGKSAQLRLLEGHVVIVGLNSLTHEIIKNIALSGVGKLTVFNVSDRAEPVYPSLLGNGTNLVDYAKGLNSNMKVRKIEL